ncbi:hypothetical protein P7C70_g5190, partial [Phenoliferia sp. Uapishka_3]
MDENQDPFHSNDGSYPPLILPKLSPPFALPPNPDISAFHQTASPTNFEPPFYPSQNAYSPLFNPEDHSQYSLDNYHNDTFQELPDISELLHQSRDIPSTPSQSNRLPSVSGAINGLPSGNEGAGESDGHLLRDDSTPEALRPHPRQVGGRWVVTAEEVGLEPTDSKNPHYYEWDSKKQEVLYGPGEKGVGRSPVQVRVYANGVVQDESARHKKDRYRLRKAKLQEFQKQEKEARRKEAQAAALAAKEAEERARLLREKAQSFSQESSVTPAAGKKGSKAPKPQVVAEDGDEIEVSVAPSTNSKARWSNEARDRAVRWCIENWDRYKEHKKHSLRDLTDIMDRQFTKEQILSKLESIEATVKFTMNFYKETGGGHGNRPKGPDGLKSLDFTPTGHFTEAGVTSVWEAEWYEDLYDIIKSKPNITPVYKADSTQPTTLDDSDLDVIGGGSDKAALKAANARNRRSELKRASLKDDNDGKRAKRRLKRDKKWERKRKHHDEDEDGGADAGSKASDSSSDVEEGNILKKQRR